MDIAFSYTTALTATDDGVLEGLSAATARRLRRGTIVVTTDYRLDPAGFDVPETLDGANDGVGGISTGFIHIKTCAGETDAMTEDEARWPVLNEQQGQALNPAAAASLPASDNAFDALEADLLSDLQRQFEKQEADLEEALRDAFSL